MFKRPALVSTTLIGSFLILLLNLQSLTPVFAASETPYFSYLGGELSDSAYAITSDNQHNVYITGSTNSTKFDEFHPPENKTHYDQNCFVTRINLDNPALNYYVEFAGSGHETCRAITVDSAFNVYVTGETQSSDLPVTTNKQFSGVWDAFVFKLNALGNLEYATYLGGTLTDYGHGIALSDVDNIFVTGETWSQDFPTTHTAFNSQCDCDGQHANAFVTHINTSNPAQYQSNYSSYLGGSHADKSHSIDVDLFGILHIAGETQSTNFPLVDEISNHLKGNIDGFVAKINPLKTGAESLIFSSYIGGNDEDIITAITTNALGDSIFTGHTSSDDYPTSVDAFSRRCANGQVNCLSSIINQQHTDSFITQISNDTIKYSTLIGGTGNETTHAIHVDNQGAIFASGTTYSADFPLTDNATDTHCNVTTLCAETADGFVVKIKPAFSGKTGLVFSSYLGGDKNDNTKGIVIEKGSRLAISGETFSANLATSNALDQTQNNSEAYLQVIDITEDGNWIDNTPKKKAIVSPSGSSLDWFYMAFFAVFVFLRKPTPKLGWNSRVGPT